MSDTIKERAEAIAEKESAELAQLMNDAVRRLHALADEYDRVAGTLVKALRDTRKAQERTQAEIAQMAGISPQYVCDIERGNRVPTNDTFAALVWAITGEHWTGAGKR